MQIIHQNRAESLAAVIISVFILSVALLGIMNIVSFSKDTAIDYETEMFKHIIKSNSEVLVKKFEYENLKNNEDFYIYKDVANLEFKIMTGSTNSGSKYIDELGNRVDDLSQGLGKTYKREFTHKSDILKHRIDPPEIPNIIFHYDAQNIDGNNNASLNDGDYISTWLDIGNNNNAVRVSSGREPQYQINAMNGHAGVKFDGVNDVLQIPKNIAINNDEVCSTDLVFTQKSFSMVIKTGNDVNSQQAIYEQGGLATGYNFMINNGDLYAGIHNKATVPGYSCFYDSSQVWDNGHKFKSVNLGEVLPNKVYYVTVVQDSNNFDVNDNPIDSMNRLQIFLNGELVSETDHVDPQPEHDIGGLGGIHENNVQPWSPYNTIDCSNCNYFSGTIGEFISWNHALSKAEVRGIHNYLLEKWLGGKQSVNYSIIDTNINKYNSN